MPENKHARFLLLLFYTVLALAGGWFAVTVLLPWLLPFLTAFFLAWLLERPVSALTVRLRFPRPAAAALATVLLFTVLCAGLGLAVWRLGYELSLLLGRLPTLLAGLPSLGRAVERWAYRLIVAAPIPVQEFLQNTLDDLVEQGLAIPNRFYDNLAGWVGGAAAALPNLLLFLFTTALATYFTSASRPALLAFLRRCVPQQWRPRLRAVRALAGKSLGGWLKAQGLLMLVTFGELSVGFLLLRVDLALLLAALTALVDALPVFGTGTVLVPWAIVLFLTGDWKLGLGLVILYAVVSAVRSVLEPKLVGERLGLPPLATLMAIYLGFRAFGVPGMILAPLCAVLLKQFYDCGLFRIGGLLNKAP